MAGQRLALVVAISAYGHPGLKQLAAPEADAEALKNVLSNPKIGNFDVDILKDADAPSVMERVEDLLTDRDPADLVLLHFSCHGIKDQSGGLYLAAANTNPARLASTAVDTVVLNRLIRRSRARRVVLFLDCCYGGAFERGMLPRADSAMDVGDRFDMQSIESGRGRVVITASSAMEYAFEGSALAETSRQKPSIFTSALVEGLSTGDADLDSDGQIALNELYEYIHAKVQEVRPEQTPSKWEFGLQGELYIAWSSHTRVQPSSLFPGLHELLTHPDAKARLVAVGRLLEAAIEEDVERALAGRRALSEMASDSDSEVALRARENLEYSSLRANPTELQLGAQQVSKGERLTFEVSLLGPAVAMTAIVINATDGIDAEIIGSCLRIGYTCADEGSIDQVVCVESLAGSVYIPVSGFVSFAGAVTDGLGAERIGGEADRVVGSNDKSSVDKFSQLSTAGQQVPPKSRPTGRRKREAQRVAAPPPPLRSGSAISRRIKILGSVVLVVVVLSAIYIEFVLNASSEIDSAPRSDGPGGGLGFVLEPGTFSSCTPSLALRGAAEAFQCGDGQSYYVLPGPLTIDSLQPYDMERQCVDPVDYLSLSIDSSTYIEIFEEEGRTAVLRCSARRDSGSENIEYFFATGILGEPFYATLIFSSPPSSGPLDYDSLLSAVSEVRQNIIG